MSMKISFDLIQNVEYRRRIITFSFINSYLLVTGTPLYMAPEAMRGEISDKIDVYSFGIVLLEMLTSIPAIGNEKTQGNSLLSFWEDVDNPEEYADPVFLQDRTISVKDWADISEKCLEVQRRKRPDMETVRKLLMELDPVSIC